MTTATAEKPMTNKQWMRLALLKRPRNVQSFLNAHREFLCKALEEASVAYEMLDDGIVLPSPILEMLKTAMVMHIAQENIDKAEANLNKPERVASSPKNWVATVFNKDGNIATHLVTKKRIKTDKATGVETVSEEEVDEEIVKGFDMNREATRWLDRRLAENPDTYGEVLFAPSKLVVTVLRAHATERLERDGIGPAMRITKPSAPTKRNPWMKVGQTANVRVIG